MRKKDLSDNGLPGKYLTKYIRQLVYEYGKATHTEQSQLAKELQPFGSKWVALVKEKVVASGTTLKEVEQKAKEIRIHKLHHVSCPTYERYLALSQLSAIAEQDYHYW